MRKVYMLLVGLFLLCFPLLASANSGSAFIPPVSCGWVSSSNFVVPYIYAVNLTKEQIDVKIYLYKDSGALIKDTDNNPSAGSLQAENVVSGTYSDNLSDISLSYSIAPGAISFFSVRNVGSKGVYGKIVWTQNNGLGPALLAYGTDNAYTDGQYYNTGTIVVNSGMPF